MNPAFTDETASLKIEPVYGPVKYFIYSLSLPGKYQDKKQEKNKHLYWIQNKNEAYQ